MTTRFNPPFFILLIAMIAAFRVGSLAAQTPAQPSPWNVSLGLGFASFPAYAGASERRALPLPLVSIEYKRRVFFSTLSGGVGGGLGFYAVRTPALQWSVSLGGADGRPESRSPALAGLGDRSASIGASTAMSYRFRRVAASATMNWGFNGGAGRSGAVGLQTVQPLGRRTSVSVATTVMWADMKHLRYEFGIDGQQAARRQALVSDGDPRLRGADVQPYAPTAGISGVGATVALNRVINAQTFMVAFAGLTRYLGGAADSPLVRQPTPVVVGLGLVYRL